MMMNRFIISIGSNCSCAADRVGEAIDFLSGILVDFRCSSIYSTPSVKNDGTIYFNAVAEGATNSTEEEFNAMLKEYECRCGRVRGGNTVVIDLDIVVANGIVKRPRDYSRDYFIIGFTEFG